MFRKAPPAAEPQTPPAEKPAKPVKPWDDTFRTIIYAVLLAMIFRSFLFEPFHIPSGSMKNTLLVGDYLFVSKFSYGYSRYSFPYGAKLFDGRIMASEPERGDIIVFRLPTNPRIDYIKRLIGLPGDKIQVIDGALHINGKMVTRKFIQTLYFDVLDDGKPRQVDEYQETLDSGKTYHTLDMAMISPDASGFTPDNTAIYTVPDGHYFMMGDNRDNSTDSRFMNDVGFVPEENLIGRAELILFSVGDNAHFWEIWKWPFAIRGDRFFTALN